MEHHVYFWLKPEHQNTSDRATFEQALTDLFKMDLISGGRWGIPAEVAPRPVLDQSWSYAVSIQFASLEAHNAYQDAPDHKHFIATYKDWWAKVLITDIA
jgi:hypothetical protein